jgi:pyridoxine 4-dehydrogenase
VIVAAEQVLPLLAGRPPARRNPAAPCTVLRRAVALGVNLIDTADSYGPHVSETLIAEALYPYPDDLVIASKGGLEHTRPGPWPENGRPDHLKEACEGSLRRLKLEQIPLYQFHRPDPNVPLEESVGALVELREQGKIRHIGLSNVTEDQLRQAQRLTAIVSIQNRYNLDDRASDSLIDLCEQEGMAFLPWARSGTPATTRRCGGLPDATAPPRGRWYWPGCWPAPPRCCPSPAPTASSTWSRTSPPPASS